MKGRLRKIRNSKSGYTLFEVLCAVLILSFALSFITPALFKSMDMLNHLSGRFGAYLLSNQLESEAQAYLKEHEDLTGFRLQGTEEISGRPYRYQVVFGRQDKYGKIFEMQTIIQWSDIKENKKTIHAYIFA